MFKWFDHGIRPRKYKKWFDTLACPYGLCPSNQPFEGAHKPKLKYNQKISEGTIQYKCKYCGNLINIDSSIAEEESQYEHVKNPALIGGKPSYRFFK